MTKQIKTKKTKFHVPSSLHKSFPNVKFVVDAAESVDIKVCKPDVSTATKLDPTNCALARAVKREHHADGAVIGLSTSYIIKGDRAVRFATPAAVQREIISFDRHHDFEPGEYYLTPKSPSNRLDYSQSKNKTSGRKIKRVHKQSKAERVRILPKGQD